MSLSPLSVYIGVVSALTLAEYVQDRRAQYIFKPLAGIGFLILALLNGALDSQYGVLILGGLMLCAFGDVFLLARNKASLFLVGIGAFALGHLLYGVAFMQNGVSLEGLTLGAAAFILFGLAFYFIIWSSVLRDMRIAVSAYIAIIGIMVTSAAMFAYAAGHWSVFLAALLFALSDVFVAKDRFKRQEKWHAFAITPTYFGAQALFAYSAAYMISG